MPTASKPQSRAWQMVFDGGGESNDVSGSSRRRFKSWQDLALCGGAWLGFQDGENGKQDMIGALGVFIGWPGYGG